MNIKNLDKIMLNEESIKTLLEWRDNHKELVRAYPPVMREGVIMFNDRFYQHFKMIDNFNIRHSLYLNDELLFAMTHNTITWKVTDLEYVPESLTESYGLENAIQDCITVHASSLAYIAVQKWIEQEN